MSTVQQVNLQLCRIELLIQITTILILYFCINNSIYLFVFVIVIDEVRIMLLYEGDWVQNGNIYYFEGFQGKGIELKKTTTYEELLKIVCHILKVDPTEHNLLMKYVFNGNIPSTPIQLRDDGDVKIFICLNCTDGKLPSSIMYHNREKKCQSWV